MLHSVLLLNAILSYSAFATDLELTSDSAVEGRIAAVSPRLGYSVDVVRNAIGGKTRGNAWAGVLTIGAEADLSKAVSWPGARVRAELGVIQGNDPGRFVSSSQAVSGLQAERAVSLSAAWLEQGFLEDRLSVLCGVSDVNDDFYFNDAAALFVNGSFGVGAELGSAGVNGVPTFPYPALGARARARPFERAYVVAGIYDGVPGDPSDLRRNRIALNGGDGAFVISEIGIASRDGDRLPVKLALGGWLFTEKLNDHLEVDESGEPLKRSAAGFYAIMEQKLYESSATAGEGLSAFGRFGVAPRDVAPIAYNGSAGLVYDRLFFKNASDRLGLAASVAGASSKFRDKMRNEESGSPDSAETIVELTYRAPVREWFAIQPDIQYIFSPSFESNAATTAVVGLRLEAAF